MTIQERLTQAVEDFDNASNELMSAKIDTFAQLNKTDATKALDEAYVALAKKKGGFRDG